MSTNSDFKSHIKSALNSFSTGNLKQNSLLLLQTLGYESDKQFALEPNNVEGYKDFLRQNTAYLPNEEKAFLSEWKSIHLLFQLTEDDLKKNISLFDTREIDRTKMQSYLFFAIELSETKSDGKEFTRTDLSNITREINKSFPMPAFIIFKYGDWLTFSIINRRLNMTDETRDVLQKVTLIKDIEILNPKRSQIEILNDLSFDVLYKKHKFSNFVELHKAWMETLDTKELNKRFFRELSNWYFWAITQVKFPNDEEIDLETHHATAVIRLITRLMFVWFLKEKGLIADDIFSRRELSSILKFNDESAFYKAILQNLFFATLNADTTGGKQKREFRPQSSVNGSNKNFFQYKDEFINPEKTLEDFFNDVPFLNGGLFECLDRPHENIFIDGFDENQTSLSVPDDLFFCDHCDAPELNEIYDTKNKKYEVRGLIRILNNYKFTIAENTPLEEEIALDPELLGKVFENLLANYNPETRTTARKQTGSFYTPREIVDFMVDESLIAYLKAKLQKETQGFTMAVAFGSKQPTFFGNEGRKQLAFEEQISVNRWIGKDTELESALHELFAYDSRNPFSSNETETEILIKAINDCKIIDPACGSGAFPMGILHRLVFLLGKLDEDNKKWRILQKQEALKEIDKVYNEITDKDERQKKLDEIDDIFDLNSSDYGRKLFLIENCIYGVDIQPIAIQISKLRFFISLIIDQPIDNSRPNRGVRPLPNLETKLVAANTLLTIDTTVQQTLKAQIEGEKDVHELQAELKSVRSKIFRARTSSDKEDYRVLDKQLREQIARLLKDSINEDSANKIADWQPDNQDYSADWFDPEWMFGIEDGFDIVIGNPPYIQLHKIKSEAEKIQKVKYKTFAKTGDIYCVFYELGNKILTQNGTLAFITSNKWMRAAYGQSLRNYFVNNTDPLILIDFGGMQVFDAATVDTNILVTRKAKNRNNLLSCTIGSDFKSLNLLSDYFRQFSVLAPPQMETSWIILNKSESSIKRKIESIGVPLRDWDISINYGIKTGFNAAFIINADLKNKLLEKCPEADKIIRPILRGRNIKKFHAELDDNWIINSHNGIKRRNIDRIDIVKDYPQIHEYLLLYKEKLEVRFDKGDHWTNLRNCTYLEDLEKEKIVWLELTDRPSFYLDRDGYFINNTVCFMTGERLPFILSFLNSKLCEWYFTKLAATSGAGTRRWFKVYVEQICIPQNINKEVEHKLIDLIDKVQLNKKRKIDTKTLEREIDQIIFAIFALTNEEINFVLNSLN